MNMIRLNQIYRATEGEGLIIGTPQIFIRLKGCHIGCLNCDSIETWDFGCGIEVSEEELIRKVEDLSLPSIKRH